MKIEYYKEYSHFLNRDMEYKIYGHAGPVMIAFPAQSGRFFDYEDFHMIESAKKYIESGLIQIVTVDSIDSESWASKDWDYHERILRHEAWFNYIIDELRPSALKHCGKKANTKAYTTGISMGAYHALNFILRRPDLFSKTICLSGIYSASYFFPHYNDELIYLNSPCDYLPNTDPNHEYIKKYRKCEFIVCVGQGNWEDEGINDAWKIKAAFEVLNVPAWIDFWGYDVNHDWDWWQKQFPYYLEHLLMGKQR